MDDIPGVAESIAMVLQKKGHTAQFAEDGEAALRIAAEFKPEVALLDLVLPDIDGYELAARLRELDDSKDLFIIAVSGYNLDTDKDKKALFDDYLSKPIDFSLVEKKLAKVRKRKC